MAAKLRRATNKFDHITPTLPVEKIINFKVLRVVYRALLDQASEYRRDNVQEKTNIQTLHFTVSSQLAVPRSTRKGFEDCAPRFWNATPGSIIDHISIRVFKRNLRTHLFKSALNYM